MILHPPIYHLSPLHPRQLTLAGILRRAPSCQFQTSRAASPDRSCEGISAHKLTAARATQTRPLVDGIVSARRGRGLGG